MTDDAIRAALVALFRKYQISLEDVSAIMDLIHLQSINALKDIQARIAKGGGS